MKGKLKHVLAATVLTACMGITSAGQTPAALGSADYQAMSSQQMDRVTGEAAAAVRAIIGRLTPLLPAEIRDLIGRLLPAGN
jgi:hypothetical protein